jgi:hypothetical protein
VRAVVVGFRGHRSAGVRLGIGCVLDVHGVSEERPTE